MLVRPAGLFCYEVQLVEPRFMVVAVGVAEKGINLERLPGLPEIGGWARTSYA